jgi:hypothetical protein
MKMVALEETNLTAKDLAAMAKKEVVILTRKRKPVGSGQEFVGFGLGICVVGE